VTKLRQNAPAKKTINLAAAAKKVTTKLVIALRKAIPAVVQRKKLLLTIPSLPEKNKQLILAKINLPVNTNLQGDLFLKLRMKS
jgi:hypothetical protein